MKAKRADGAEGAVGLGILLGLLAAFLPWYSYSTTTARVTVDGFRASLLGDLFFLAVAAAALLLLIRRGVVSDPLAGQVSERSALIAIAGAAAAAVLLQLMFGSGGGRSLSAGMLFAVLAAAALAAGAWMSDPRTEHSRTVREMLEEERGD